MVKLIPPVNFYCDENIQTIFGTKLEDFFKLLAREFVRRARRVSRIILTRQ
jgi:hypothetical protein